MLRRRLLTKSQFVITFVTSTVIILVLQYSSRSLLTVEKLAFQNVPLQYQRHDIDIDRQCKEIYAQEVHPRSNNENPRFNIGKDTFPLNQLLQGPAQLSVILAADNPQLVEHVRKHILIPPSELPYNLKDPNKDSWDQGQGELIYGPLKQHGGFFVEAGAFNGEYLSNSLHLEKHLGWKGLLVEANTKQFNLMKSKHRKAWCANACLSTKPYPMQVTFEQDDVFGKIIENPEVNGANDHVRQSIQCVPLFTFMLALNQTTIDYFSLDVEGSELDVLRTIPFDRLDIKFLSVEVNHVPEGMDAVIDFMKSQSYKVHEYYRQDGMVVDVMFIK